jgi:hypothetical protein
MIKKKSIVSSDDTTGSKIVKQVIWPKSTIIIELTVEGTYSTVPGSSASVTKFAFVTFKVLNHIENPKTFSVNYKYLVIPG